MVTDNIYRILDEEIQKARNLGIDISPYIIKNIRFIHGYSVYGQCRKTDDDEYIISLNENFYKNAPAIELQATIMHEILHTITGSYGHDKLWKDAVRKVLSVYSYDGYEEFHLCPSPYSKKRSGKHYSLREASKETNSCQYTVICPNCHYEWFRKRQSNLTRRPQDYRCKKCNVPLQLKSNSINKGV